MGQDTNHKAFSSHLLDTLKRLLRLTKHYHTNTAPLALPLFEQEADAITQLFDAYPEQTIAQCNLFKPGLPKFLTLQFNALVIGLVLCRLNKWNATTTQQFIAGLLCWTIRQQPRLEKTFFTPQGERKASAEEITSSASDNQLLSLLKTSNREIWLSVTQEIRLNMVVVPNHYLSRPYFENKSMLFAQMALFLAIKSVPLVDKKAGTLTLNVKRLAGILHASSLSTIEPLFCHFDALYSGQHVLSKERETFIILGASKTNLYCKALNKSERCYHSDIVMLPKEDITHLLPVVTLKDVKMLDTIWVENWQGEDVELNHQEQLNNRSYRLDKPPSTLKNVLVHMENQDISVDALCKLIAEEPTFVEQLKASATQASREKLNVKELKHGILMNGMERTKSVLVQQALITRLNQHYFPLQNTFFQFLKAWAYTAASIAKEYTNLVPEQVNNWVYFSCSGLFTNAELKSRRHWLLQKNTAIGLRSLASCRHPEHFINHAITLAESWMQDRELLIALKLMLEESKPNHKSSKQQAHTVLLVSFFASYVLFTQGTLEQLEKIELLPHLNTQIGISAAELRLLTYTSLEKSHTYSPISSQIRVSD